MTYTQPHLKLKTQASFYPVKSLHGEKLKSCLGWVFNIKLFFICTYECFHSIHTHTHVLKTQPKPKPCPSARNSSWRGRLSRLHLLIKIACFVKKYAYIFGTKSSWSESVSTRSQGGQSYKSFPFSKDSLLASLSMTVTWKMSSVSTLVVGTLNRSISFSVLGPWSFT